MRSDLFPLGPGVVTRCRAAAAKRAFEDALENDSFTDAVTKKSNFKKSKTKVPFCAGLSSSETMPAKSTGSTLGCYSNATESTAPTSDDDSYGHFISSAEIQRIEHERRCAARRVHSGRPMYISGRISWKIEQCTNQAISPLNARKLTMSPRSAVITKVVKTRPGDNQRTW